MSSSLRQLEERDAEQVAALFVEAFGDSRRLDALEIRGWLDIRELKPEYLRVLEVNGRVVGYGDIWPDGDAVALDVAAPENWAAFFEWAEEFARSKGIAKARVFTPAGHELASVAASRGYRPWRSSYTMEIDLPVDGPMLLDGIEIRAYRPNVDAEAVRLAENEAFAGDPFHHEVSPERFADVYLGSRGFEPDLWQLGWDGDELAGFVLAYSERVGDPGLGWVGTLGVRGPWRRRGLGEALLRASFATLHDRGLRRAGLGVDTENVAGALRLYERVGMRVVRRYDNWEVDV
jgi:ribosomal protein S18 acetylase RimI-like enzyme